MKTVSVNRDDSNTPAWRTILRNKYLWISVGVILLILVGGYYAYDYFSADSVEVSETSQIQTSVARSGDLTVFASGAGQVVPTTEVNLGFDEAGTLAERLVKVGDQVQAGEVIARLETNQSEDEIALALAEAELNVLIAQQALDDIYDSVQIDTAQALLDVETVQQTLEDLLNGDLRQAQAEQAVAEAQEAVSQAQRTYYGTRSTASSSTIDAAYAELVLAEKKLKDQEAKFDDYVNKPDEDLGKANAQLKLSAAQAVYDNALRYYNAVTGTGSELDLDLSAADLAAAQAKLAEAERDYERIKDGATPGEISLAEANLALAEARYETLKAGVDPTEVALAEANLANAQAKLAIAREDQAVVDLLAPLDGTIMSISASVGEAVGTNAIIVMADLKQPVLEVYLDEADLDKVAVGFEVEVVFDSLPDDMFTGHVTEVSPSLQTVSNVDAVLAWVQLDAESFSKPQSLPVGSNASVDVIGGRTQNTVLVPVEAVREIGPDEYAVFVMEDGEPRLRIVTVGLMDYTSAEILTGLSAGEIVTTGVVETN
ncbi:MAG TPA: efflux RND transporter periplasmic adaptor subunit [Anaerolineales bacterium]|nr:efflux RND transporter periplasmic adaptor subunit [Anaerolineales bacterium]